jgi:hypothetical protein
MSPEQLIGTIKQVDAHDTDSREDPWLRAGDQWSGLTAGIKGHYRDLVGEMGPSQEEVGEALRTLGHAAQSLTESVGQALRDPETRQQLKQAAASFLAAVGRTFTDLGEEIRRPADDPTADAGGA